MAKRSDFAQKLLDDLRLRKEQMAMSQTSSRSNRKPSANASGNYRQPSRGGSRAVNSRETIGPKTGDRHNRTLAIEGSSKEIVPMGRTRNSEQIGDLSMALAFALENGEKLGKMASSSGNPVVNFLHHFGRAVNSGEMGRSSILHKSQPLTGRVPTLSHIHIKEISKGAQKLNQILKACSNGLNFDRYSIEIGKELLKGAMELEESLRMLVNLQEASEYMVNQQRKPRIRLLEGDDDDDDDDDDETAVLVNEQKQLDRPKFSFDKPSRNYHKDVQGITKSSPLEQRLLALSYHTEAPHFNSKRQGPTTFSNSVSHRRSVSCDPDSRTLAASSDRMKHSGPSHSKTDNGRIPNVIAKLMGLEELPPNMNSKNGTQKDTGSKQEKVGKDSKQIAEGSTKKVQQRIMASSNPVPQRAQTTRQHVLQANISVTTGTSLVLEADKGPALEMVVREEIPHLKDLKNMENMNLMSDSKKPTFNTNKPQVNMSQLNQITGTQKDKQDKGRRQEKPNPKEEKRIEEGERKGLVLTDDLQRMVPQIFKHPATNFKLEKAGTEENTHQKEKKNANKNFMPSNQQKAPRDSGSQQPRVPEQPQATKLQEVERERQNRKNKLQIKKTKGNETWMKNSLKPIHHSMNMQKNLQPMNHVTAGKRTPTEAFDAMPSEGSPKNNHHEVLIREGVSTNHRLNTKNSPNRSSKEQDTDVKKVTAPIPLHLSLKPVHVQPRQKKVDAIHLHKSETPQKRERKIDEVVTRKNGSHRNMERPLKQQISVMQELKQRTEEKIHRSKEAEISISRSNKAEGNNQTLNFAHNLQKKADPTSILCNPVEDRYKRPREPDTIAPHATSKVITSKDLDFLQAPLLTFDKEAALKSSSSVLIQIKGPSEGAMISIVNSLNEESQKVFGTERPLTENENHLKQILMKSQIFLNAAETLFELQIPIDILHTSANKCQDEDSKLVLDCGYEVMKRKGRRKELTFHPRVKISFGSMNIKNLNDLVKELHEDLEELKFCSQNGSYEYDTANYLHKILETDIQNRNPDVNCMWDFGWSEIMFAYLEKDEVIRDVEKYVLNGLIDDITRDILHVSITI